jgi:hypothetical protein
MHPLENKYSKDFLVQAHKSSAAHKMEMLAGSLCGCFHCEQTFLPAEIEDWIEEKIAHDETAICPKCGIDSVLSDKFPVSDKAFLTAMNKWWF